MWIQSKHIVAQCSIKNSEKLLYLIRFTSQFRLNAFNLQFVILFVGTAFVAHFYVALWLIVRFRQRFGAC